MRQIIIALLIFHSSALWAQDVFDKLLNANVDTAYYSELSNKLTLRGFSSHKYSEFTISDDSLRSDLRYKNNPTRSLGLGFSYKFISLNLGYGFSFANQGKEEYGKTTRFDFLTQFYLRKFTINLYSSIYRGFYLDNSYSVLSNWEEGTYYTRPDIEEKTFGVSVNYVFNNTRYSNKALHVQTEWQKKSAGSLLAGGSVFHHQVNADSSMIPSRIYDPGFYRGVEYLGSKYTAVAGHIGYTYTLVVKRHFFLNAGITGGFAMGQIQLISNQDQVDKGFKISATLLSSFGFGYNSEKFYAGFSFSNFAANSPSPVEKTSTGFSNGKYQLVLAYRFGISEKFRVLPKSWPIDI